MEGPGKIIIGVSSCLLGNKVRYDGKSRSDLALMRALGKAFVLFPVCPEVEAGLSVPREPMELYGTPSQARLRVIGSDIDLTGVMDHWAKKRIPVLAKQGICGFVFKSRSPSCAVDDAVIISEKGGQKGPGLFRSSLTELIPPLPVADNEDLADAAVRENFIERVRVYRRWQDLCARRPSLCKLVAFHSDHKLLIMAHSLKHYSLLGKLVAGAKGGSIRLLCDRYIALLMEGLQLNATRGKHANVLQHAMGYFKNVLSAQEKQELLNSIEQYRLGTAPLRSPLARIRRHLRKHPDEYLLRQVYLDQQHR
ncbi:MAG: DUF523 and DUF1722 domain-containing protein [Nitrospirota bacterium]|nr:DUF523 and DUF1722 domain-containing protein [Nitrospirota bacterium]